ncbi:MAG: RNA polymerase sigma factor, partial [Oscillospiraceae bacterium]
MDMTGLTAECGLSAEADSQTGKLRADSEAELSRLVEKFSGLVFRVALCHVKNPADADDIMQDAFLALYSSKKSFTDEEHIKAWLIRVTVNKCKNLLRSCGRRLSVPLETAEEVPFLPKERFSLLPQLMKLKPKYRVVLYMFYYEDYSVGRIAELLGEKQSTVTTRLARGRNKLRELLIK